MPRATGRGQRGVSLPELLMVMALLGLGLMVSVPLVADRIHDIKLQAAVSEYAMTLRAARMVAVSKSSVVTVTVSPEPTNTYTYLDASGRDRTYQLPTGAWFDSTSSGTIVFDPDGSVASAATSVLKTVLSNGRVQSWTVQVPATGIPVVTHDGESGSASHP